VPSRVKDVVAPPWKIPKSWCWTRVAEVGIVRLGRQRSPENESALYPTKYLRAANITSAGLDLTEVREMDFDPVERQIYGLRGGDVVLAEASGSAAQVGRAAVWSNEIPDCCFQNTVIRFRPHAVISDYALRVFQHLALSGLFAGIARGVGIQHLGVSGFARAPFPLPPLAEQERISKESDRQLRAAADARESIEDALRRTTEQDNIILEAAAFGGLVATTNGKSGLGAQDQKGAQPVFFPTKNDGATVFSAESSELLSRALPVGWKWVRVDQAGDVRLGRQRSPEHEYGENMMPYLRVANVFEDHIDSSDIRAMNFSPQEQETFRLRPGDILLNEGQSPELVGRPALYIGEPPKVCYQNTLLRFRHAPYVNPHFALLVFRYYLRSGHFTRIAKWSTNIAHLGSDRFASMPFPLPPLREQKSIVAEAQSRLDASKAQRTAIASSLGRLKDMSQQIIRSAVSGTLVAQMASDESADDLLARLGPPFEPKPQIKGKEKRMPRRAKHTGDLKKPLYDTLVHLNSIVTPDLLFKAAGYDPDSITDVEKFYLALREELGRRIREHITDAGTQLEVITDAAR
jgi:Type I restriction modification DNA specificity domain